MNSNRHEHDPASHDHASHDPMAHAPMADAFDQAARRAHAASLERLSPRVQAQLALRRRAATAGPHPAATRPWAMLALGSAAALTLAIGVFVTIDREDRASTPSSIANAPQTKAATGAPSDPSRPTASTGIDADTAPVVASLDDAASPDAATSSPTRADNPANDAASDAIENDLLASDDAIAVDALPDTWLAAEFDASIDDPNLDLLEETPDFYLWLGSDDALADLSESL